MNLDTARKINGAACAVWFFQQGLLDVVPLVLIDLINVSTVAQIQSAAEVMEADNEPRMAEARAQGGPAKLSFILNPDGAAAVKAFAAALPKVDPTA